jgi:hypothetical protein
LGAFLTGAAAGAAAGAATAATAGVASDAGTLVFFTVFLGPAALIVVLVAEVLLLDISTHSMPSMTVSDRINFYVTAYPSFAFSVINFSFFFEIANFVTTDC